MVEVKTIDFTRNVPVDSNDFDDNGQVGPNSKAVIWEVIEIYISIDAVQQARTGHHEIRLRGESPDDIPEYLVLQSYHNTDIEFHRSTLLSANLDTQPRTEAMLSRTIRNIIIDSNQNLECYYENGTDEKQTNPRNIKIRVLERKAFGQQVSSP